MSGTLSLVTLFAVVSPPLCAVAADEPGESRADALLQRILDEDDVPSISVCVSCNGRIVYRRALGLADVRQKTPATTETRYSLGSVSKCITAVAAMQLAEAGKLDLDAPVQMYCPAFPAKPKPITARQLLAHTAGIRHYDYRRFEEDFLNKKLFPSISAALSKFANDPLIADPGTEYHYSSWGYCVVGCAIEGASGESYADYIQRHVAATAEMPGLTLDVAGEKIANRATGYSKTRSGAVEESIYFDSSDRYPAGGLLASPTDVVHFGNALLAGKLLDAKTRDAMWSAATLKDGRPSPHALGWKLEDSGKAIVHGGTTIGTTTYLHIRPKSKTVVAIAVNLSRWERDRNAIATELTKIFASRAGE